MKGNLLNTAQIVLVSICKSLYLNCFKILHSKSNNQRFIFQLFSCLSACYFVTLQYNHNKRGGKYENTI